MDYVSLIPIAHQATIMMLAVRKYVEMADCSSWNVMMEIWLMEMAAIANVKLKQTTLVVVDHQPRHQNAASTSHSSYS